MKRLVFSILVGSFLLCVSVFGVTVSIPNVNVNPGATTVQIPLQFNDATGVDTIVGFQTTITFDSSVLQATGISNGSLTSNWTVTPNIDNPSGSIKIGGFDPTFKGFRGGSGSLCVINLNIIGGTPGLTYPLTIASSKLSNPYGTLISHTTQNGSLHIIGYSISGTVNLVGGTAQVTSVTLNLTGAKTATTNPSSNGNYSFTDLPPGNYTITPTLQGYVFNPLNRQVTITNSNITNQNFTGNAVASVSGTISYQGQKTGTINIGLFTTSDFSGDPPYGTSIASPGNYQIKNVAPGTYYAGAYMDTDNDGQYDQGVEPAGVYAQNPITLTAGQNKTGVNITLREPVTLTVISQYGSCSPQGSPGGTQHTYLTGDTINASVTSPVLGPSGTRYVCTGGTGTGSAPATLNPAQVTTFTITQNSTITWNWKTQYLLTYSVEPAGSGTINVSPSATGNWYDSETQVTLTPTPGQNYIFQYWIVDGQQNFTNPLILNMNSPHTVVAKFAINQPELTVSPTSINFYFNINTDGTTKETDITIKNTGSGAGTLNWQINPNNIVYQQGNGWITNISKLSGSLSPDQQDTVTIKVDRTGLNIGVYNATIPVTSNAGNKNISVKMIVNKPPVASAIKPSDETIVDTFIEFYASFTQGAGAIDRSEWKIYEGIPGGRVGGGDLIKTVQLKGATNRIILPYSLFKEGQSYRWTVKCWDSYGEESELSEKTFTVKTKQELPVSQIGPQVYTVVSLPDSTKGETAIVTNNSTGTVYIRPLKVSNLPVGVRENFANLFDIKIEGIGEGATAKITFEIPGNYAGWLKLVYDNKNQEWVLKSMPGSGDEYAKLTPSTTPGWTKVELQLKDGGTYDFDDIPGTISDPSGALEKPTRDSGGCFIATACFGNYNHPIVKILREFRDRFLLTNKMGKIFVKWYYIHSPKYAEIIAQNSILKGVVILALVPFVIFAYICVKGLILPFILLSLLTILFKKN